MNSDEWNEALAEIMAVEVDDIEQDALVSVLDAPSCPCEQDELDGCAETFIEHTPIVA